MRTVRNITVAVSPELYRQTRMLAAEYDTTVTSMVAYLLERFPDALKRARYPKGGPKPVAPASPAPTADQPPAPSSNPPSPEKTAIPSCDTINPNLTSSVSDTCPVRLQGITAPVSQYDGYNYHI